MRHCLSPQPEKKSFSRLRVSKASTKTPIYTKREASCFDTSNYNINPPIMVRNNIPFLLALAVIPAQISCFVPSSTGTTFRTKSLHMAEGDEEEIVANKYSR